MDAPILPPTPEAVEAAARAIRAGRLVAFPTETVYGLGCDASDGQAVARLYEAKGRPRFNPLISHLPDLEAARAHGAIEGAALDLARAFWPGPLTLVARARGEGVAALARAGLETVALRVPSHGLARALLRAVGRPVAAPSANPSGAVSPTTAAHVADGFGERLAMILDGGPCEIGLESTIIGFAGARPALLRPGGITRAEIEAVVGPLAEAGEGVSAPGQLKSHYAPALPLRLDAEAPGLDEAFLGFGAIAAVRGARRNLSPSGDLVEAAANLFRDLRALDAEARLAGLARIAVAPIPETGLGEAIADRLARAAAPRE